MEKLNKQQGKHSHTQKRVKTFISNTCIFYKLYFSCYPVSNSLYYFLLFFLFTNQPLHFTTAGYVLYKTLPACDWYRNWILFSNINCISSTSISREGQNVAFMKYIPVSLKEQIQGKVNSGILISFLTALCSILPLFFIFPLHAMDMLIVIVCSLPSLLFETI